MIALAFTFLAGRYHATGWDHHVNEGTVEWPPSPWRILRALVAASHRIECDRPRLAAILEQLTSPPDYYLPPTAPAHLRHYMPTSGDSTTKVFDAFLAVGGGAAEPEDLLIAWPIASLTPADTALLAAVVAQIPYLGRAESWVAARLSDTLPARIADARPRTAQDDRPATTARLLVPLPTRDYHLWRDGYLAAQDPKQVRKLNLPDTLWDVLSLETGALQQAGWSAPPGTRWIEYAVDSQQTPSPNAPAPARTSDPPDYARIVFDSAVLPRVEDTLWIGEKLRAALLHHLGDHRHSPALLGKDPAGQPLTGHRHAFFLPQANDDGFVTQVVIYARGGLDPEAVRALRSLQRLYRKGEALTSHPTYTTLVALGHLRQLESPPPPLRRGRIWESATPFVPPRCPKRRGGQLRDSPEDQLRWLCRETIGVEPSTVIAFDPEESRRRRLHWFRRTRQRGGPPAGHPHGYGFRMEFPEAITGPLAIGYGSHFGLGQFTSRVDSH